MFTTTTVASRATLLRAPTERNVIEAGGEPEEGTRPAAVVAEQAVSPAAIQCQKTKEK